MDINKEIKKDRIRFLKHAIKYNGKRAKVRYSKGGYTKESGLPEGTITVYAKEYNDILPAELNVENETDVMTDYFDKDKARITPKSKYYKEVNKLLKM